MWGESNSRTFQGHAHVSVNSRTINTEEKELEINKILRWIVQNATLMSFKQLYQTLYQFNKMSVLNNFECQTISENIQKLKQEKFKDFQALLYKSNY